jgi:hypothetical protein
MALCGERDLEEDKELSKEKDYGMNGYTYNMRIWNEFNRLRVKLGAAQGCNAGFYGIHEKS